jgi:hypothetical protein
MLRDDLDLQFLGFSDPEVREQVIRVGEERRRHASLMALLLRQQAKSGEFIKESRKIAVR